MSVYKGNTTIDIANRPIVRFSWRRGGGPANEIVMQGSFDRMYEQALELSSDFDAIDIVQVKGEWFELRAAQQGDDVAEDHDVDGSNFTQSTVMNLLVKSRFTALGVTDEQYNKIASTVNDEVNKKKAGNQTYDQMQTAINTVLAEMTLAAASEVSLALADDIDQNGEQFFQAQYVYRHTQTVAERIFRQNKGTYVGVYANTHRIFTEDQLRTAERIPVELSLPQKVIDGTPAEWLKNPTRARIDRLKRTLITEYLFADKFSRVRYAPLA